MTLNNREQGTKPPSPSHHLEDASVKQLYNDVFQYVLTLLSNPTSSNRPQILCIAPLPEGETFNKVLFWMTSQLSPHTLCTRYIDDKQVSL